MSLLLHRKVHRYVGRRFGGHRLIASSIELSPEEERLLATRTDLAGDDLGVEVPAYASYTPLARHGALTWTVYDPGADRTGAVRSETVIFEPLLDPFALLPFVQEGPRGHELEEARERDGPTALEPLRVEEPPPLAPARLLEPLAALPEATLVLLLSALESGLPLALLGSAKPIELLRALFALAPRAGRAQQAVCTGALAPRPFARLVAAPDVARDRFLARAARERDLALVDVAAGRAWNAAPLDLAARIAAAIRAGGAKEVVALVERASLVTAFTQFADLAEEVRYEELTAECTLSPEESVELANHLRRRGAPAAAVLDCYRSVLGARELPPERVGWFTNIFMGGFLPLRLEAGGVADTEEAASVEALVRAAAAADLWPSVASFIERAGALYPAASAVARGLAAARVRGGPLDAASVLALGAIVEGGALAALAVRNPAVDLTERCIATLARGEPRLVRAFIDELAHPRVSSAEDPRDADPERTGALMALRLEPPTGRLGTGRLAVRVPARVVELTSLAARELLPRLHTLADVHAHRHALARIARTGEATGRDDLARLGRARAIELALAAGDLPSVALRLARRAERGGFEEAAWVLERWGPSLHGAAPALGHALATSALDASVAGPLARRIAQALPDPAWSARTLPELLALGELAGPLPRWEERLARAAEAALAPGEVDRVLAGPRAEAAAVELARALRRRPEAKAAWLKAATNVSAVIARTPRAPAARGVDDALELARAAEGVAPGFGALLGSGELDVAELAKLGAPVVRSALAALGRGFHLKVQNGVEALVVRAAQDGVGSRELLLVGLEHLAALGDRELGARVARRIREVARADDRAVLDALSALESGKLRRPSAK